MKYIYKISYYDNIKQNWQYIETYSKQSIIYNYLQILYNMSLNIHSLKVERITQTTTYTKDITQNINKFIRG